MLADALRQKMLGQEFTETIRSIAHSNTEMMKRQAQLGETVRDALKAVTDSVLEIVSVAHSMSETVGQMQGRIDQNEQQLQDAQRGTQQQLNSLQGAVDNAAGPGYEMKTASNIRSLLRQHLGLRNARILKGPNREPDEDLMEALDQALEGGAISENDLGAALLLDVIARVNTPEQQNLYVAVEISITVSHEDVTRTQERAETIRTATGTPTVAVVIGVSADDRAAAMIEQGIASFVSYPVR